MVWYRLQNSNEAVVAPAPTSEAELGVAHVSCNALISLWLTASPQLKLIRSRTDNG